MQWLPREANVEADALTNLDFKGFTPGNRIEVKYSDIQCAVLPDIMGVSTELYKEVCEQRASNKKLTVGRTAGNKARKTAANKRMKWTDPW